MSGRIVTRACSAACKSAYRAQEALPCRSLGAQGEARAPALIALVRARVRAEASPLPPAPAAAEMPASAAARPPEDRAPRGAICAACTCPQA
jgi:hypothetical protein